MIGQCKNCKHWGVDYDKVCEAISFNKLSVQAYLDAYASDDQGLDVQLVTAAEFGCALFRPKQKETTK